MIAQQSHHSFQTHGRARTLPGGPHEEGAGLRPPSGPFIVIELVVAKIAQSQSLAISTLTEPSRQKSWRKKGFWAQKSQPEIANR